MHWSTSVLSTLSSDTQPSIVITFDSAKYIFNASENIGRALVQNGRNWKRTRGLFFTQARVERTSGLPGLLMTLADTSIHKLDLIGPEGLTHMIASMRTYTFRDSIEIRSVDIPYRIPTNSANPSPIFSDENITVFAIPILPFHLLEEDANMSVSTNPLLESPTKLPAKRKRPPSPGYPRKRSTGSPSDNQYPIGDDLLVEVLKPNFRPTSLTRELAHKFLEFIIWSMFPNTNPPVDVKPVRRPPQKGKGKQKAGATEGSPKPLHVRERGTTPTDLPYEPNPTANVDNHKRTRAKIPPGFHLQLPTYSADFPPSDTPPTMAYVIVGPRFRGKFNAKKAGQLGIDGPSRGLLTKGRSVTFKVKEGHKMVERTVHPDDVIGKSETPGVIVILDIPTVGHIPSLVSSFKDSPFYSNFWSATSAPLSEEYVVRIIYHTCGDGVLEHPDYKAFMKGFGPDTHHIVASKDHCPDPLTFTSYGYNQLRLNKLDEKIFPIPKFSLVPKAGISAIADFPRNVHVITSSTHAQIRPFTPPVSIAEVTNLDRFHPVINGEAPLVFSYALQQRIKEAQEVVAARVESGDYARPEGSDVGIVPLGTGGSLPSKYRNVLSTLIRIPSWGNLLLDAGEGTWGQLVRNFGLDEGSSYSAWQALRDLKCIFASHIHGDHHMGLAQILAKRRTLDPPPNHPLYVVSIRGVHMYLRELSDIQDLGLNDPSGNGVIPILSEALHYRTKDGYKTTGPWQIGGDEDWLDFNTSVENGRQMCLSLGLEFFKTVDVFHRCRCFGCAFKHKDGWSIVFSGDTQPTDNLVWAGNGATLLIHEATMADDEAELAKRKSHSTIGQAVEIGKKMQAKNILLTHFSARYPKMPPPMPQTQSPTLGKAGPVIVPAFDLANMTIGDMWKVKHYMTALELNYQDTKGDDDDDADLRPVSNIARA